MKGGNMKKFILIFTLILITTTLVTAFTTELEFIIHPQANLPEQDVFIILNDSTPDQVRRITPLQAGNNEILSKEIFTALTEIDHDPFQLGENPLGPFQKGNSLNMTLKKWLSATGKGTYSVNRNNAELNLEFKNLVPNATYTVWCSRITFPPNPEVIDNPCGANDGSENVFITDLNGKGDFNVNLDKLPETTERTATVIALAYHSDNTGHGSSPGEFGKKSHVHIFSIIPGLNCMQNTVMQRDDAIIEAWHEYNLDVLEALEDRRDNMITAWGIKNLKEKMRTLKDALIDYREYKNKSKKKLEMIEQQAWRKFYQNRALCGEDKIIDDKLSTQFSEERL